MLPGSNICLCKFLEALVSSHCLVFVYIRLGCLVHVFYPIESLTHLLNTCEPSEVCWRLRFTMRPNFDDVSKNCLSSNHRLVRLWSDSLVMTSIFSLYSRVYLIESRNANSAFPIAVKWTSCCWLFRLFTNCSLKLGGAGGRDIDVDGSWANEAFGRRCKIAKSLPVSSKITS